MPAPVNHPTFCFDDSPVAIQIENVRFKVHKYQLMKSETFVDILNRAKKGGTEGEPIEGSSLENPIMMEGVSALDFECLLTVLYANPFSTQKTEPKASLIIPAFRLAKLWNFSDLHACLLPLAEKELDDVDKIVFAREFNIKDWLSQAHVNLCQRLEHLSIVEAKKLGIDSVLMISLIREEFPPSDPSTSPNSQSQNCSGVSTYCNVGRNNYGYSYGGNNYGSGHCSCCSQSTDTTRRPDATILGKINKWVENNCIYT